MDRWQAMRVFVKVAEQSGFAQAARSLDMSPPAVTRAISFLEDGIGAQLLIRTTRAVKLTEAGQRYYEDCRRILADLADAESAVAGTFTTPTGLLTVTAPMLFGQQYVLPIVLEYLRAYPAVTVQTLFLDRISNLVEEGIDVAIRIGHLPDSELHAMRIGAVRRVLCAAPSYLSEHGEPLRPADLPDHHVIASSSIASSSEWRFGQDQKTIAAVRPRLICNHNAAAIAAAMDGCGITRVLSYQVWPAVTQGRLKLLLTDFEPDPLPVHVVHTSGRAASAKVRSFVDFAVERLRRDNAFK